MYITSTNVGDVVAQISTLPRAGDATVLLLVGEKSTINLPELLAALRAKDISVAGGIFPGIINGVEKYEQGIIATVMPTMAEPLVVRGLNTTDFAIPVDDDLLKRLQQSTDQPTALVLVDGLTKHIALFLERLQQRLAGSVNYIGGGAGSLKLESMPCVFDAHGIYQDAALIVLLNAAMSYDVQHGYRDMRGPFRATYTEGTIVHMLDSRPALDVYRYYVEMITRQKITPDNFFELASGFPLGVQHQGSNRVVRDAIAFTDNGGLICVGEVPNRSLLYIMRGQKDTLMYSAKNAAQTAFRSPATAQHYFVVDCISRVLYLKDDFKQELEYIASALPRPESSLVGILSLGEVGSYADGVATFFNKTVVVGALQPLPEGTAAQ